MLSEKMFSEDQLEQLRSFPEISRDELIRYFTPAAGDVVMGGRIGVGGSERARAEQRRIFPPQAALVCCYVAAQIAVFGVPTAVPQATPVSVSSLCSAADTFGGCVTAAVW